LGKQITIYITLTIVEPELAEVLQHNSQGHISLLLP